MGPPVIGNVIGNLVGERVGEKATREMGLDKAAGQVGSNPGSRAAYFRLNNILMQLLIHTTSGTFTLNCLKRITTKIIGTYDITYLY